MSSLHVCFLDKYGNPDRGVDHLGMRVAGEAAYSHFIDFITTVTWRPRYFSFWCWALQMAWDASAKQQKDGTFKVNKSLQQSILKRLDYTLAASTLILNNDDQRVAGSTVVKEAFEKSGQTLEVRENHLQNSKGSYDIYVGSMRVLGLVETASKVDRPSGRGERFAQVYVKSLGPCQNLFKSAIEKQRIFSINELRLIGKRASLSAFNETSVDDSLGPELFALRDMLFGPAAPAARRLSVGLILRAHILMNGRVNLSQFRSLTLLNGLRTTNRIIFFELPEIYQSILPQWSAYQAHAFATYALENLLKISLDRATVLESHQGEGVAVGELVAAVIDEMVAENDLLSELPVNMTAWWDFNVKALKEILFQQAQRGINAEFTESDLYALLTPGVSSARTSFLLFLFSTVRLQLLIQTNGSKVWLGSQDPFRLPPHILIEVFGNFVRDEKAIADYAHHVILHHVIIQHHKNAMRKLAATPKLDTSKFSWEGNRLVPNGSHRTGTSNPRFDNAVFCLNDLGYLDENGIVTAEGHSYLNNLERVSS